VNFWIISDTHFCHEKITDFCNRPSNYEELLIKRISGSVREDDVLIHLGDVAWQKEKYWHEKLINCCAAKKKWLILGNHDKRSINWYLTRGWDAVTLSISLNIYGKNILFSHKPFPTNGYDLNIHGHFHNIGIERHEPELRAIMNDKHFLIKMEHTYAPITLKSIAK